MGSVSLDQAVKFCLAGVKDTQRSRLTLDLYERALRYLCTFREPDERITPRFGDRNVGSFTRHDITTFFGGSNDLRKEISRDTRKDRIDKPLSPVSLHVYARALRSFWRWAYETELIEKPVKVTMPKLPVREIPMVSDDEIEQLIAEARRRKHESLAKWREYVMLLLLACTGARRNEVLELMVDDVELDKDPPTINIRHGKGNRQRRTVIHPDIRQELLRYTIRLRKDEIDFLLFFRSESQPAFDPRCAQPNSQATCESRRDRPQTDFLPQVPPCFLQPPRQRKHQPGDSTSPRRPC